LQQQYEILRKENDWLYDYVGKQFSKSIINKVADRLYKEHGKYAFPGIAKAIVTVNNKYGEILGIGGSSLLKETKTGKIFPDLTLNNFGIFFNSIVVEINADAQRNDVYTQDTGSGVGINTWNPQQSDGTFNVSSQIRIPPGNTHGHLVQAGSGSTAPTKTDITIETPFTNSPEDTKLSVLRVSYDSPNARVVSILANVAGGAGTVNELCYFAQWFPGGGDSRLFMLFRDAISPGVPFIATQTITMTYTFQL